MSNQLLEGVIESLQPTFAELVGSQGMYWSRYQHALELIKLKTSGGVALVNYLNAEMNRQWSSTPEHSACCDVASSLCEADSYYASLFKFN